MKKSPTRRLWISLIFVGILVAGSLALLFTGLDPVLGLDLKGGVRVVLTAPDGTPPEVMQNAADNIRARVDSVGVAEPELFVSGLNIEVQIPGTAQGDIVAKGKQFCITGADGRDLGCLDSREEAEAALQATGQSRLLDLIGTTARLEQREVTNVVSKVGTDGKPNPEFDKLEVTCPTEADRLTPECSYEALKAESVVFLDTEGVTKYEMGPVVIPGDAIKSAQARFIPAGQGSSTVGWVVAFQTTSEGANTYSEVTRRLAGTNTPLSIVVDKKVISAPVVQGEIRSEGEITGNFAEQEARDLATELNAGALPVELTKSSIVTVSATLGEESLHQALIAGLAGLVILALYLAFYYRVLGLVTWVGMTIWAILAFGIVSLLGSWVGYALTLPGVAGLIVSLGITADSYIVFYERLKDEIRSGKTPRVAVQPAFKRAWHTIIAADVVTLLAAGVLYLVAISSIRGFALTLGVAVLLDMFVVYFFKRPVVFLMARGKRSQEWLRMGLGEDDEADASPRSRRRATAAEPGEVGA